MPYTVCVDVTPPHSAPRFRAAATDASDAVELMIDSRRGRLLKALNKLLMGPVLMGPMERLRLHSYALLAAMLVVHIVCYVAVRM